MVGICDEVWGNAEALICASGIFIQGRTSKK
jgi:hypothetical protein